MNNKNYEIINGDCLEVMDKLIEKGIKVDMILTDPPYGTTKCKWDSIIPFDEMWSRINKLIKDNGAIVLFGTEPFSSYLRLSNIKNYRYEIIWEKSRIANFLYVNKQIGKCHENISIFYKKQPTYTPQLQKNKNVKKYNRKGGDIVTDNLYNKKITRNNYINNSNLRYPRSIQRFKQHNVGLLHPTQKPVDLLEFLIKSYTLEGQVVLDFTMGSGSTGEACINTNRKFIGIELDEKYFNISKDRLEKAKNTKNDKK